MVHMKEKTWDMLRKTQKKIDEKGRIAACKHEARLQLVRMKKYEPFEYGELNVESMREAEEEATKRRYYFDETRAYPYPNLVKRRRKLAMTQTDVERAIGAGQSRYVNIERGTTDIKNVSEDVIRSIEDLFKEKADWLFCQNDETRTRTEALREKRELREAERKRKKKERQDAIDQSIKDTMPKLIEKIKKRDGTTTQELADRIGIGRSAVRNWEKGGNVPTVKSLEKVAAYEGVSVEELFPVLKSI